MTIFLKNIFYLLYLYKHHIFHIIFHDLFTDLCYSFRYKKERINFMKVLRILKYLFIIVFIVALYIFMGIVLAYGKHPEVSTTTLSHVDPTRFDDTPSTPERATILEHNSDALFERIRLIHNAQSSIILSTFSFQSDESGSLILAALLDAANRGVQVNILADGFNSWVYMEGNPYFYALSSHEHIHIKTYNRVNPLLPWKMMGRMHDKYLIVDNQQYILGGRNTYNYFLGDYEGHKNYDRDVLVVCDTPTVENSVADLLEYFHAIWNSEYTQDFHNVSKLQQRKTVKDATLDLYNLYEDYSTLHITKLSDTDYLDETYETTNINLLANPIHTGVKEPLLWYELNTLMENATEQVRIHTPYIICNNMMYDSFAKVSDNVSDFSIMTNSVANNGNPFGAADLAENKDDILDTGIQLLEYEGGYSYHAKSMLIDEDISVIGSFNMDMRSTYLNTELMLVIESPEINKQLSTHLDNHEEFTVEALPDGTYHNPNNVAQVSLTPKREKNLYLVQNFLLWLRFLF